MSMRQSKRELSKRRLRTRLRRTSRNGRRNMSVEIKVPTLGESIVEATVGKWMKQEGEQVAVGEPLVELETDKVNMEVAATGAGVLRSIVKHEGETVGIGETLALVGDGAVSPAPAVAPAAAPATAA